MLFLYARHHIPGTDGADVHHQISHDVGNTNRHDDATIGFERPDLRCCNQLFMFVVVATTAVTDRRRHSPLVERNPRDGWFLVSKKGTQLAGDDLTSYETMVELACDATQVDGSAKNLPA